VSTDKAGQNVVTANTVTCGYFNINGHRAENCRKRQAADYRPVRSDIICFKCGKQGHRQFTCPHSSEKDPQKTAALQCNWSMRLWITMIS